MGRYKGLVQATKLVSDLRQAHDMGEEELRELFNDRHFDRHQRQHLLSSALTGAPRSLVQKVLRIIDGDDVDISERDDEELLLVQNLVGALKEEVRCCRHTFFKMKSDWIASPWKTGVAYHGELSPDQICDHIEEEENHEDLLKTAINMYLRNDRKFEAAKMLAIPDSFSPVEEMALVLPCASENFLYIDRCGEQLDRLEREALSENRPLSVGIWWFWRCYDPRTDFWPRASFMALAYDTPFAIVDFQTLEEKGVGVEHKAKTIVRR